MIYTTTPVYLRAIMEALGNHSEFFQLRYDAVGQRWLSPLTKCIAAMRMLAYGIVADCVDEYMKIGATIALECMKNFAIGVIEVFGNEYLRKPTEADVHRLLQVAEARDFPRYVGKYRLHALEVEELSRFLEGIISKETLQGANYHSRSSRIV